MRQSRLWSMAFISDFYISHNVMLVNQPQCNTLGDVEDIITEFLHHNKANFRVLKTTLIKATTAPL